MADKKELSNEGQVPLKPNEEAVKVEGKLFYNDGSWNTIRLKKEVLSVFPQLKEKESTFSYTMVIPKSVEESKKALLEIEANGRIPILLLIDKDKDNG